MNRILIILLAAIGLNVGSKAETLPYESMLKDGNTWWYLCDVSDYTSEFPFLMDVIAKNNNNSWIYYKISIDGDSIYNGVEYRKIYVSYDRGDYIMEPSLLALMREDGKRVYGVQMERHLDLIQASIVQGPYYEQTGEYLYYDYDDPTHVWGKSLEEVSLPLEVTEQEMTNGNKRKSIEYGELWIIEGIGFIKRGRYGKRTFIYPGIGSAPKCWCGTQYLHRFTTANHENEFEYPFDPDRYSDYSSYEFDKNYLDNYLKWLEENYTGVESVAADKSYPSISQTDGAVTITHNDNNPGIVTIVNTAGSIVKSAATVGTRTSVATDDLPAGIYVVQYSNVKAKQNKKIQIP